ncbi:MAG: hypothetical protein ACTSPQ_20045 [Candidatus Helarchaeota archaeon]
MLKSPKNATKISHKIKGIEFEKYIKKLKRAKDDLKKRKDALEV